MTPYYTDDMVTLYLGDMREILPALDLQADCIVTDPPYAETSLAWDRWPNGWPTLAATIASSMWCFGSMRMFLDRRDDFADWKFSQDVIWRKPRGTSHAADRFTRVHEHAVLWYHGKWADIHHEAQRQIYAGPSAGTVRTSPKTANWHGEQGSSAWVDDGTRLTHSVIDVANLYYRGAIHPTEKPIGILDPLIRYACPPGGLVLDPFAGSGSTLDAARQSGRRGIGIEAHEPYAEAAARRLSALTLPA